MSGGCSAHCPFSSARRTRTSGIRRLMPVRSPASAMAVRSGKVLASSTRMRLPAAWCGISPGGLPM
ncbi:hypothetical protein UG56_015045 [Nocardioides luteus]|uniref:Uncharacterized protein n=1 Tax=Nocardioides luteus TaxID=1844 RepID=A0A1J4N602_9ACTN|nr:hypothetical protein UG56_015045 [Nocardioides luteus]